MRITISKSAKQNSLTILVLLLFCTGLYILISETDYPWQWYRVWEHIAVYDEGQWWAGALLFGLEQTHLHRYSIYYRCNHNRYSLSQC